MNKETKSCPHCGAQLPVGASFCPHCAQDISQRKEVSPPRHMPRWALYSALMVLAALLLTGGLYLRSRPRSAATAPLRFSIPMAASPIRCWPAG